MARKLQDGGKKVDFDRAFTVEQAHDLGSIHEKTHTTNKVMLMSLTRSRAELVDGFDKDPDTLIEVIDAITNYREHVQGIQEITETALARLFVVAQELCRRHGV